MTGASWRRLVSVNIAVNASVRPMNDFDIYGKDEVWAYPHGAGDCEDYVLEKRRILMGKGMSPANLLITVVRKPDGEGHAVLTVRTNKGDFILDNLTDSVRQWDKTGYRLPEAPGHRPYRPLGDHPRRPGAAGRLRPAIVVAVAALPDADLVAHRFSQSRTMGGSICRLPLCTGSLKPRPDDRGYAACAVRSPLIL